jgi:hypothetical protein
MRTTCMEIAQCTTHFPIPLLLNNCIRDNPRGILRQPITTHTALSEPIPRPDHQGTSCVPVLVHATSRITTSLLTAPHDKK